MIDVYFYRTFKIILIIITLSLLLAKSPRLGTRIPGFSRDHYILELHMIKLIPHVKLRLFHLLFNKVFVDIIQCWYKIFFPFKFSVQRLFPDFVSLSQLLIQSTEESAWLITHNFSNLFSSSLTFFL